MHDCLQQGKIQSSVKLVNGSAGMARTQEEMIELEASKKDRSSKSENGIEPSTAANITSMSRDVTLLPIETSPRRPSAEKVPANTAHLECFTKCSTDQASLGARQ